MQDYLQSLNIRPLVSYAESTTRAVTMNYANMLGSEYSNVGNALAGCITTPQQLRVDIFAKPIDPLCIERKIGNPKNYDDALTNRLWLSFGLLCICLGLIILVNSSAFGRKTNK